MVEVPINVAIQVQADLRELRSKLDENSKEWKLKTITLLAFERCVALEIQDKIEGFKVK